ncbi:sensor histidine kinase [Sediminibacillus dalangtanensis]|uniref:histidine kinase n=1 Tax=Sediminibacillus dalangtanensis TaxID=2729421 RepID=A0ABX7VTD5_9BACI|nr:histidine kinase [Sediminibacillus dalangtanensis]QTM99070.1 sensor histidine kinase [Sediminibacillus dalangtanensis]
MYRYTFWLWFLLLAGLWGFALLQPQGAAGISPARWIGSALLFALYFLLPLFRRRAVAQAILLSSSGLVIMAVFWPLHTDSPNYFSLLLFAYLAGEAAYRLPGRHAFISGAVIGIWVVLPAFEENGQYFSFSFLFFYLAMLGLALSIFHRIHHEAEAVAARYDALLHEYRGLKRKAVSDEKLARQQERAQIGREIHDSVGHKLTNLLMQLEVARMEAGETKKERISLLKELAQESLDETRRAVKAWNEEEIGGIPAMIRLIRKLEAENFIRIQFSVKNRAFSARLTPEQAAAVYRAVQESLTNVMRHGPKREASITFESAGERIFRFEISNPILAGYRFEEGYGLTAMKERVQQAGGSLEILAFNSLFIVRGMFPLKKEDVAGGSDSIG